MNWYKKTGKEQTAGVTREDIGTVVEFCAKEVSVPWKMLKVLYRNFDGVVQLKLEIWRFGAISFEELNRESYQYGKILEKFQAHLQSEKDESKEWEAIRISVLPDHRFEVRCGDRNMDTSAFLLGEEHFDSNNSRRRSERNNRVSMYLSSGVFFSSMLVPAALVYFVWYERSESFWGNFLFLGSFSLGWAALCFLANSRFITYSLGAFATTATLAFLFYIFETCQCNANAMGWLYLWPLSALTVSVSLLASKLFFKDKRKRLH